MENPEKVFLDAALAIEKRRIESEAEIKRLSDINAKARVVLEGKDVQDVTVPPFSEKAKTQAKAPPKKPLATKKKRSALIGHTAVVCWAVIAGAIFGAYVIPMNDDSPSFNSGDLQACISDARVNNPIPDNQYQELVNALYTCEVYDYPS